MTVTFLQGNALDVLRTLPDASVHCVVTSPPYWGLRDYGTEGQIGLEPTPQEYVANMVAVFREVRRVLRDDGTCWLNLGDSYASNWGMGAKRKSSWWSTASEELEGKGWGDVETAIPPNSFKSSGPGMKVKDLCGIPWRVAFALQEDGWWLRSDIIWHKPNPMPESVTDRPTKAHEYVFLLTKSARYFYDTDAIRDEPTSRPKASDTLITEHRRSDGMENYGMGVKGTSGIYGQPMTHPAGRNARTVWTISTAPYSGAHFAVMPPKLVEPCIKAGTSAHGCCPVCGAPWVRVVERTPMVIDRSNNHPPELRTRTSGTMLESPTATTTGWRPTCAHDAEPIPCTVLDPFSGAGTTALVALGLGRNAIGIELNPQYIELAQQRINAELPLLALEGGHDEHDES